LPVFRDADTTSCVADWQGVQEDGGLSDGSEAGADQFVVGARVNHYELGT